MANVFKPNEAESTRHLHQTDSERRQYNKEFKEQKAHEQKLKEERFDAMRERRKSASGAGKGINIEVTGDD